jgi:hypothetical protein
VARLLPKTPKWYYTVYRGDEQAWEDAKAQCRRVLYDWASGGKYGFYSDLTPQIKAIPWPDGPHTDEGQQVAFLLGQVAYGELRADEDRPVISALVVLKEDNLPSKGFWDLCAQLGVKVGTSWMDRQAFWIEEVKRCFHTYAGRRS